MGVCGARTAAPTEFPHSWEGPWGRKPRAPRGCGRVAARLGLFLRAARPRAERAPPRAAGGGPGPACQDALVWSRPGNVSSVISIMVDFKEGWGGLWEMNWVFSELIRKPNRVETARLWAGLQSVLLALFLAFGTFLENLVAGAAAPVRSRGCRPGGWLVDL